MGQAIGGIMGASEGLLLGRRTYEMFAPAWSTRTAEEDPGAPFMNDTTKYVVTGHAVERRLAQLGDRGPVRRAGDPRPEGAPRWDLYVSGSATLVRALLADGLVDELHLFVFPLALGAGLRLFPEGGAPVKLALGGSEAYDSGVVHLTYVPARSESAARSRRA